MRCYHATKFVMEYTEAKVLKLKHFPDNPLQHTDIETTRKYYAQPGSDDIHEARERLFQDGRLTEEEFYDDTQQQETQTQS